MNLEERFLQAKANTFRETIEAPPVEVTAPTPQDSITEIPRSRGEEALGYIGELLTKAGVALDQYGIDIPALGRVTLKDLTVGEAGKVLEDMSYGFMPTRGAGGIGGTSGLEPEAVELANIVPGAAAVKTVGKAAAKAISKAVKGTK